MATVKKKMATMKPMATVKKRSRSYGRLERSERLACGTRDACYGGVATPTAMTWPKPRDVDPQLHDSSIAAVAFEWKGERGRRREADLSRADAGDTGAGISPRGRVTCYSDIPCIDMAQGCLLPVRGIAIVPVDV